MPNVIRARRSEVPSASPSSTSSQRLRGTNRVAAPRSLASQLPADWRRALAPELEKPYFKELERFVAAERKTRTVFPASADVFAALKATPLNKVKVVLLGQDPYPTAGNANGLSFSVNRGMKIPASLRNIFVGAREDVGTPAPIDGDLTPWAEQGVLLLNSILTVREGEANSHKNKGWEQFTRAIVELVKAKQERVVFLNLGKAATKTVGNVAPPHLVLDAPHPSPLNTGNPFARARVFSATNRALVEAGRPPIDWRLPSR